MTIKLIANYAAAGLAAALHFAGHQLEAWALLLGTFAAMKLAGFTTWPWRRQRRIHAHD